MLYVADLLLGATIGVSSQHLLASTAETPHRRGRAAVKGLNKWDRSVWISSQECCFCHSKSLCYGTDLHLQSAPVRPKSSKDDHPWGEVRHLGNIRTCFFASSLMRKLIPLINLSVMELPRDSQAFVMPLMFLTNIGPSEITQGDSPPPVGTTRMLWNPLPVIGS